MSVSWRSLHSVIRFCPGRAIILFAGLGLRPLAAANEDCAIRDAEAVRDLDLNACRPEPVSAAEKAAALLLLPIHGAVSDLAPDERRKLVAIDAVLRTQARDGIYEVRIIAVPQAWTGLHQRAVLLISRPALDLLTSEELQALAAHEIGHEYIWGQYTRAKVGKDAKRLRELELICDGIAVVTLTRMGIQPERLGSAVEKVFRYNRMRLGEALDADNYPSVEERRRLIKEMTCNARFKLQPGEMGGKRW